MVNTCANPRCHKRFRRLGEGRLFLDDGKSVGKKTELIENSYWLCRHCAARYTIEFKETGAMLVSNATGREELVA